jgi:hypothetical protein
MAQALVYLLATGVYAGLQEGVGDVAFDWQLGLVVAFVIESF